MSFFNTFPRTVALMALLLCCSSGPEVSTISLIDHVEEENVAVPWRVTIWEGQIKRLVRRGKAIGLKLVGAKAYHTDRESIIRLPAAVTGRGLVMVRVTYRTKWEDEEEVEARLVKRRKSVVETTNILESRAVNFELAHQYDGAGALELIHRLDPGMELPIQRIVAGELEPGAGRAERDQLRHVLAWLGGTDFDTRQGLPERRRLTISLDGCTRDCIIMSNGDSLRIRPPGSVNQSRLRFWFTCLSADTQKNPLLMLEARINDRWSPLGEWVVQRRRQWTIAEIDVERIPPGSEAFRFTVHGPSSLVAVAEPVLIPEKSDGKKWNLILIDLDTVRADRLGCYGYKDRPTSSRLDSILEAKGFALFRRAYSPSPWTLSSTAKFLASRYLHNELRNNESTISPRTTMLAEIMRENGYYCVAYTGGVVLRTPGFERGFHEYYWSRNLGKVEDSFPQASSWIESSVEPFFVFLHTYEAHEPYTRTIFSSELPRGRLNDPSDRAWILPRGMSKGTALSKAESLYVQALYDGGVRMACDAVADLFACLETMGLWDRTAVVILSDHGEEFWEHFDVFARHGHSLYKEQLEVPFTFYYPGRGQFCRVEEQVSLVDLVPTAAELLGLKWSGEVDGVSLVPLMRGKNVTRSIPIMASLSNGAPWGGVCLFKDNLKYMETVPIEDGRRSGSFRNLQYTPGTELYRTDTDPGEQYNLAESEPELSETMARSLSKALARTQAPISSGRTGPGIPLGSNLTKQLQALGYMDPS